MHHIFIITSLVDTKRHLQHVNKNVVIQMENIAHFDTVLMVLKRSSNVHARFVKDIVQRVCNIFIRALPW